MNLPVDYDSLNAGERRLVRELYVKQQEGNCYYCGEFLGQEPPERITGLAIEWKLFPPHFLKYPVHLQHNHDTGMTEGAVHAYCNAVMWQYEGR